MVLIFDFISGRRGFGITRIESGSKSAGIQRNPGGYCLIFV